MKKIWEILLLAKILSHLANLIPCETKFYNQVCLDNCTWLSKLLEVKFLKIWDGVKSEKPNMNILLQIQMKSQLSFLTLIMCKWRMTGMCMWMEKGISMMSCPKRINERKRGK